MLPVTVCHVGPSLDTRRVFLCGGTDVLKWVGILGAVVVAGVRVLGAMGML